MLFLIVDMCIDWCVQAQQTQQNQIYLILLEIYIFEAPHALFVLNTAY